jgi:hypothetical protein
MLFPNTAEGGNGFAIRPPSHFVEIIKENAELKSENMRLNEAVEKLRKDAGIKALHRYAKPPPNRPVKKKTPAAARSERKRS